MPKKSKPLFPDTAVSYTQTRPDFDVRGKTETEIWDEIRRLTRQCDLLDTVGIPLDFTQYETPQNTDE